MKPTPFIGLLFGWCILRILSAHNNKCKQTMGGDLQNVFQKLVSAVDWLIRDRCSGRPWITITDIHSNSKSSWELVYRSITYVTIDIEFSVWPCPSVAVHINTCEGMPDTYVTMPFHEHYTSDLSDEQLNALQQTIHSAISLYTLVEVMK